MQFTHFRFRHIPQLDGFRGLAVSLVLVGHWIGYSSIRYAVAGDHVAQMGVLLFFVLSGFLITGLLCREHDKYGSLDLRRFYIRRLLRLGPALILFLLVTFSLVVTGLLPHVAMYEFAACLLYLRNIFGSSLVFGHLWSLSLEEQYYLLWPWAVRFLRGKRLLLFAAVATLLFAGARTGGILLHWYSYESGIFYMRPWFRFDSILTGCCVTLALRHGGNATRWPAAIVSGISPVILWAVLLVWTLFAESWSNAWFVTIQTALVGLLLLQLVMRPDHALLRIFSQRGLRFLGKISYSLYLWQQLFLVVKSPGWGSLRLFPFSFVASAACALASWYLIEAPALRQKERFAR
jgi:peptidoglycan/LPS O-acetylase OafA/YrhL